MCDDTDLARWAKMGLSRRQFSAIGVAAGIAACTKPGNVKGKEIDLNEQMVRIATADGTMDAFFVHPASGAHPGVIVWPDIAGLRDTFKEMARRLAGEGYAVLVLNPFYRDAPAPQFSGFADFAQKGGFQLVEPWRAKMTPDAVMRDGKAAGDWLGGQAAVDKAKGLGVQGYCMGGACAVRTAGALPEAVKAVGSFHGGALAGDDAQAPAKLLAHTHADYLFAIAQNDDAKAPTDKDALRKAADEAKLNAEIEVYPADHGWTVPDSPAYNAASAEKAWGRLLALYSKAL